MNTSKSTQNSFENSLTRREFVAASITALGAASMLLRPQQGFAENNFEALTIRQVIDLILKEIPTAPYKETVDTIKSGSPDQPVTGIVTTMFATVAVIKKAIALKANFIIAHEPTFYNHLDETTWLESDPVYEAKRDLLVRNNIVVWRFHDYWHSHRPDGVQMGVLTSLGWEKYYDPQNPGMITLPPLVLSEMIVHLKAKLGIKTLRVVGNLSQVCQRIALLPGASGGRSQIQFLQKEQPDVLLCGEIQEWETSEYMRDARELGEKKSLVVLGHSVSEEPGMQWLVPWLQPKVKGIMVTHVPSQDPFVWA